MGLGPQWDHPIAGEGRPATRKQNSRQASSTSPKLRYAGGRLASEGNTGLCFAAVMAAKGDYLRVLHWDPLDVEVLMEQGAA